MVPFYQFQDIIDRWRNSIADFLQFCRDFFADLISDYRWPNKFYSLFLLLAQLIVHNYLMRVEDSPNFIAKWLSTWIHSYVWDQESNQKRLKSAQEPSKNYNHIYYDSSTDYKEWAQTWKPQANTQSQNQLKETLDNQFRSKYRTAFIFHFISIQISTLDALLFFYLFQGLMSNQAKNQRTLTLILLTIGVRIIRIVCGYIGQNMLYLIGQRMYHCVCQAIIDKTVRTTQASDKDKITNTEISKLMHLDAEKLLLLPYKRASVLNNIISILSNAFMMIFLMSWVGLLGFFLIFVNVFLFVYLFSKAKEYQIDISVSRDTRIKKTMQIFEMIKFIKITSLQNYFYNKLIALRDLELQSLRKANRYDLIPIFIGSMTMRIIINVVCLMLVVAGQRFDAAIVFTVNLIIKISAINKIGQDSVDIKQVEVALVNIEKYLRSTEIAQDFISYQPYSKVSPKQTVINIAGSFYWSKAEQSQLSELTDIKLHVQQGQFIAIIGKYGSGKSSLLHCLLGELNPRPGASVSVKGKLAYVGQRSWIINGSVKENILFDEPFIEKRYKEAINRACLGPDLAILEFRDETIIGERGCNLSGGQKLRIAFARALYSDADIYLFDDVLSSVDAHVGSALFNTMREHLRGRTLLLVTHSLSYLQHTDRIFLLEQGRITTSGSFEQIRDHPILEAIQSAVLKERKQPDSLKVEGNLAISGDQSNAIEVYQGDSLNLYVSRNDGWKFILGTIIFQVVSVFLTVTALVWSNQWAYSLDPSQSKYFNISLAISVAFGILSVFFRHFQHTRSIFRNMHKSIIESLMKSPLSYFEQTHFAKIISVLSADLMKIDRNLVNHYNLLMIYIQFYFATIVVVLYVAIVASSLPLLIVQLIFLPIFLYIYFKCINALNSYSRLQQEQKIPVNNVFDEAIEGFSTIRAHRKEHYQKTLLLQKLQHYCHCNLVTNTITSYNSMVTSLTFFAFLAFSMFLVYYSDSTTKYACILIASILRGEDSLLRVHQSIIIFYPNLKSVKKCQQLINLEGEEGIYLADRTEQDVENQVLIKHSDLFKDGSITLKNYSARYKTRKEKALNNLSLTIRHGERIGVVGRTGSGKSTLILSLMRSIPLTEGRIEIGGKDISKLTLSDLRSNISVILQENFLFAGTVRENIDPTSSFSDERVEEVLKLCGLWKSMEARGGLDAPVSERGDNLSAGEKQLVNIARALLSPKKIVLMDEATANIDSASDEAIQKVMRQQFEGSTVVTIAHRISTVVSYDRVLVLEAGRVAEFDAPAKLLANKDSLFSKLYAQVGTK